MKKILLLLFAFLYQNVANAQNYQPEYVKNLCVLYLVPSDIDAEPNYQQRVSDVLNYAQQWFKDEMTRNGYPNKTFGLFKDPATNAVRIDYLKSTFSRSDLTNGNTVIDVADVFYNANPTLKGGSRHVLILMPAFSYDNLSNGGAGTQPNYPNQPYAGIGRYCIAEDNIYMDMFWKTNKNANGRDNFSKWVGGLMHEMGHAFQLPHNNEPAPISGNMKDAFDVKKQAMNFPATYRPSLMGIGNYSLDLFPNNPTILTASDAAMLDRCEVFDSGASPKTYYGASRAFVDFMSAFYDTSEQKIKIAGTFNNLDAVAVGKIAVYLDPNVDGEGVGVNNDYNAISYAVTPSGNTFSLSIPLSAFTYTANEFHEIKVKLLAENGSFNETVYRFTFDANVPKNFIGVIPTGNIRATRGTAWTVTTPNKNSLDGTPITDQQSVSESGASTVDGNYGTIWHTPWSGGDSRITAYPHEITIDTKTQTNYEGWTYSQRIGDLGTAVKTVELQGSTDNTNFSTIGVFQLERTSGIQYLSFPSSVNLRYLKFRATAPWTTGSNLASIAEIDLWKGAIVEQQPSVVVNNTGWTATAGQKISGTTNYTDEENNTNQAAQAVLDNNGSTFWHSRYTDVSSTFPHEIVIDTKQRQKFTGWAYLQRSNLIRAIKDAEVWLSDDGVVFTKLSDYTLVNNNNYNVINFSPRQFRYFKIIAKSAYDGQVFASLASVDLLNNPNLPLPVTLTAFNAKTIGSQVRLNWSTSSEQNAQRFEVLRLEDNNNNTIVSRVDAKGNATEANTYQATDFNPLKGTNYYQLWQYDNDGKLAVKSEVASAVVMGQSAGLTIKSISNGTVNFDYQTEKAGSHTVYVTNILGQRVASQKMALHAGLNALGITYKGNGILLLTVEDGTEKLTKKFVAK